MADVYVAGAIVHVEKEHWKVYEKIGELCEELGLSAHIPHIHTAEGRDPMVKDGGLGEPDPVHVFHTNYNAVKNARVLVVEVSNPSIGTGIEIGFALEWKKPIICLAHSSAKVTRMVRGPAKEGKFELIRYETEEEAMQKLRQSLSRIL